MASYYNNNRRYQYGTAVEKEAPQIVTRPRVKKQRKPKTYKKVEVSYVAHPVDRIKLNNAVKICLTVGIAFVMLFSVILLNAQSSKINLQNIAIENEIGDLKDQIEKLNLSITTSCDIKNISDTASEDLGMGFPEHNLVEYVNIPQETVTETENTSNEGFFAGLINLFKH